jgi:hypothetical protein
MNQRDLVDKWLLFPRNIGFHLSIDETSLSHGELYTTYRLHDSNLAEKGNTV